MPGSSLSTLVSSAENGSTSFRFRNGRYFQPLDPSNTCTAVLPAKSISVRDLLGRFISCLNGSWTWLSFLSAPAMLPWDMRLLDRWPSFCVNRRLRSTESPAPASIFPDHDI